MEIADGLRKRLYQRKGSLNLALDTFLEDRPFTCRVTSQSPVPNSSHRLCHPRATNSRNCCWQHLHPSGWQYTEVDITVLAEQRSDQLPVISRPTNTSLNEKKRREGISLQPFASTAVTDLKSLLEKRLVNI